MVERGCGHRPAARCCPACALEGMAEPRRQGQDEAGSVSYVATLPLLLTPALAASGQLTFDTNATWARWPSSSPPSGIAARRATGRNPLRRSTRKSCRDPPVDPFSGQAYRMEHRDGQLFVYSIGPNRTDEHGAYDAKRYHQGGPDDVVPSRGTYSLRRQQPPRVAAGPSAVDLTLMPIKVRRMSSDSFMPMDTWLALRRALPRATIDC